MEYSPTRSELSFRTYGITRSIYVHTSYSKIEPLDDLKDETFSQIVYLNIKLESPLDFDIVATIVLIVAMGLTYLHFFYSYQHSTNTDEMVENLEATIAQFNIKSSSPKRYREALSMMYYIKHMTLFNIFLYISMNCSATSTNFLIIF